MADRWVALQASFNFRDLGGWETADGRNVRWRRVFRSDTLHRLTKTDVATLADFGLRTVIDLRSAHELLDHGTFLVHGHEVTFHHLPIVPVLSDLSSWGFPDAAGGMGDVYLAMARVGEPSLAAALNVLGDADAHPAVFHCAAGKDRTGILAAVLLGLLGVPAESIVEDYVLTEESKPRAKAYYDELAEDVRGAKNDVSAYPADVADARAESIATLLSYIDDAGGFDAYARAIGVKDATVERLRDALVE